MDESAEGTVEQSAGTGAAAVQSARANRSAIPKETEAREPVEEEQEEEVAGVETAMEMSVPISEEGAMAVASTHTPTPDHT